MYSDRYFCPILTKSGFSRQILIEVASIKFHENPSSGSRPETCGQTDMTKVHNFASTLNTENKKKGKNFLAAIFQAVRH